MKIAVIKGSSIGDAVLAVPLLRNLHNNYPDAKITMITEDSVMGLKVLKTCPYISKVVQLRKKTFARKLSSVPKFMKLLIKRFDIVVVGMPITTGKIKLAYMMRKNKMLIPEKLFYESKDRRIADIDLEMLKENGLAVDNGFLELFFDNETMKKINEMKSDKKQIVIYKGRDSDTYRSWYNDRWIELINRLGKDYKISLIGGDDCKETAREIAEKTNAENLVGEQSLEETAIFVKKSRLIITTNGGPLHLAAALKVPIVLINTSSSKMWYPQTENVRILQGQCESRCLNDWCIFPKNDDRNASCRNISVKDVEHAVNQFLK